MNIPKYESRAGVFFPVSEIVKGHKIQRIDNTDAEEWIAYTKILESNGYILYEANEIPAGIIKTYNKNMFYAYKRDNCILFVSWMALCHRVYIVSTENDIIPSSKRFADITTYKTNPVVVQCKLSKGYVYVVKLRDGSVVLIDGDRKDENDTKVLYNYLKENALTDGKIKIDTWMFTHPDNDHIVLATEFMKNYSNQVEISAFAYQFTDCDKMQYTHKPPSVIKKDITAFENNICKYYSDALIYTLHTGQKFCFSGAEIEVLLTADMLYPYSYISANDTSAVLRVIFENGKKVMFLGDCMQYSCRELAHIYGGYLKSDVMQVAHHGLIGGDLGLYKLIDPEICLWSTSAERFMGALETEKYHWCIGEGGCDYNKWIRDDSIRKRKHYHLGETAVIDICKL